MEDVEVNESHVRAAGEQVVTTIKPSRGRPGNPLLELHVEGLVAIVQEFSGKPVLSQRYKDSVYAPEFPDGISQIIPKIVQKWDKDITTTQLVNMVCNIRKKYAGKPLRFVELFPGYGGRIEKLNPNIPIYCP